MNKALYLTHRIELIIDHLVMNSTTKAHSSFSPLPLDVIIYSHKEAHKSPRVSGVDVQLGYIAHAFHAGGISLEPSKRT